jgi:hypothetical protein
MDCAYPVASPLHTTGYALKAENRYCSDSLLVLVEADQSRRIYAPNIFSPNDDGKKTTCTFWQSPDETIVRYWQIFDRWGSCSI